MAARRPLVSNGGNLQELPSGDTLFGVPLKIPVLLNQDTQGYIPLNADSSLPLLLNSGTTINLPVTVNG